MPSGPLSLRVYVAPPKLAPVVRTLQVQLPADSNRTLKIVFSKSGELSVAVQ